VSRIDQATRPARPRSESKAPWVALGTLWAGFVVAAIVLLDLIDLTVYGLVVPGAAVALALVSIRARPVRVPGLRWASLRPDRADLLAIAALYHPGATKEGRMTLWTPG
jgi:hypothetical protein